MFLLIIETWNNSFFRALLSSSSRPELLEQLWRARAEKKKLRKTIREFEEDFYQHNGRSAIVAVSTFIFRFNHSLLCKDREL